MHHEKGTGAPPPGILISVVLTALAGVGMAMQGAANGELGEIFGHGLFGAVFSFASGLIVVAFLTAVMPSARAGVARAWRLVRSGDFAWWQLLGGIAGASIVVAQSITIPLTGVAVFTMSYVCGQLAGALIVDNTELPPGGRTPPTVWRIVGTLIVLLGVSLSAVGVLGQGIPLWAPLLPLAAGVLLAFQQAFNGRLRMRARSAVAATFTNFLVASIFLLVCVIVLFTTGARIDRLPELPGQWWTLIGGVLGVVFIGVTTVTVARLGVLLLSLVSLFGSLFGSLVIDLTFLSAHAEVNAMTFISMAVVLLGVATTTLRGRQLG